MSFTAQIIAIGIVGIVLLLIILWGVAVFNAIIFLRNNIKKAWSNIDVLLRQRQDELMNLIAVVKGYAKFEKGVLESLTHARMSFTSARDVTSKAKASDKITNAVKSLFAVAENYPTLKADEQFLRLQKRITGLENEIADRREFFNDSVNIFNTKIQSFPDMAIAKLFGFNDEMPFQAGAVSKPTVSFDESESPDGKKGTEDASNVVLDATEDETPEKK